MIEAEKEIGSGLIARPSIGITLNLASLMTHLEEKIAVLTVTGCNGQEINGTIYHAAKNVHSFATT